MSAELFDLSGRVAIVTGASRGIYLTSRAGRHVTGIVLTVDGGLTLAR